MTDTRTDPTTDPSPTDKARDAAEVTAEKGQEVASAAVDQAKGVASVAGDQIATVGSQAVDHARTVVDSATSDVRDQLEQRLRTLSEQARTTAEELQALVEGRPDDAGRTRDLARSASTRIEGMADKVDEQLDRYRRDHDIEGTWEARERVVVALTGGPEGEVKNGANHDRHCAATTPGYATRFTGPRPR